MHNDNMKRKVIILRGVSGSGKSTFIEPKLGVIDKSAKVVSADHYFFMKDGQYIFKPSDLPKAHAECFKTFIRAVQHDSCDVVVDNTNCTLVECAPYIAIANAYDLDVYVMEFDVPIEEAVARNMHGTPYDAILRQQTALNKSRSEWPPWWPCPTSIHLFGIARI